MRGKGELPCPVDRFNGITPAYAGKRVFSDAYDNLLKDHPRLCGEKFTGGKRRTLTRGSPPPMRGKVTADFYNLLEKRITPAYAGKSLFCCASHFVKWDHPRLCGEKPACMPAKNSARGSPPPMRGKDSICGIGII